MLSIEDKILIKTLLSSGRTVRQIIAEFPERNFKRQTLFDLARSLLELSQVSIRRAIDSWRRRVVAVVAERGGHIQGVFRKNEKVCDRQILFFFTGSISLGSRQHSA